MAVPGVADLDTLSARGELVTACPQAALSDACWLCSPCVPSQGRLTLGLAFVPSGPAPTRPALAPRSLCSHTETPSLSPALGALTRHFGGLSYAPFQCFSAFTVHA